MSRVVLHFDDGTKIDFNNEEDALHHLDLQGQAGVQSLNEEAPPEAEQEARLKAQLAALKAGEPATGDPYRAEIEPVQGKKVKDRGQLDKAVTALREARDAEEEGER